MEVRYGHSTPSLQRLLQRDLERIVLGVTLRERKTNTWIRQKIRVKDRIEPIKKGKHRWASNVSRVIDNRLTIRVAKWIAKAVEKNERAAKDKMARRSDPLPQAHMDQYGQRSEVVEIKQGGVPRTEVRKPWI